SLTKDELIDMLPSEIKELENYKNLEKEEQDQTIIIRSLYRSQSRKDRKRLRIPDEVSTNGGNTAHSRKRPLTDNSTPESAARKVLEIESSTISENSAITASKNSHQSTNLSIGPSS
ncbi:hypothetical protein CWC28_21605, partial [Pseudoalteromonas sp. S4492]|uniref:hypothetical protein n=1 Tax=Pseudoalteromonas sp. S4492 TaxID=579560 RepID=UPI0012826D57